MNVLLILDHAPDYRETFLRELSSYVNLTIIAQSCTKDNLTPPVTRVGYKYIEISTLNLLGFKFQPAFNKYINEVDYDVICVALNIRYVNRIISSLTLKKRKLVWWGQVYGRNDSPIVNTIKKLLINKSQGCLVYSKNIEKKLSLVTNKKIVSFNNTEVSKKEFRAGVFSDSKKLKLLFVGRNQERKRLDRLLELAKRLSYIELKLVGPGMDKLIGSDNLPDNIQAYGHTTGVKLNSFFDWCDVVVNPGHVGLLVMNAARHGKSIIIDSSSHHAPEYILAEESSQSFIDFSNINKVIEHMNKIYENKEILKKKAQKLQECAFQEYNIEKMAKIHYEFFRSINNGNVD